ncbi:MAG: carboxypeptidase regulatory-like domain-containing protein [Acidobacteria bacterium]|nr:carboxypeptidase regulatory-like domain-containing protein [Acidobacteriota bacterium]
MGGNNERFLMAQVSDLDYRQRQYDRIRGLAGSDTGDAPLRCSESRTGTGIYMGHVSGVEGPGAFEDVEVLLTCGNRALERTVPGPDGGFVFMGLPDGDYVVTVRKTGFRGPPARRFRLQGGVIISPRPGDIDREYVLAPLDPHTFVFHWEEDQSTSGYDYAAHVNQPLVVEFLGEPVEVSDSSSAIRLNRDYSILLVDSESGTWTTEHAYRLLETMKTIPQDDRPSFQAASRRPSRWLITSEHVENDIRITGGSGTDRTVRISEAAFVYASPRIALIEGKRGKYYSQRLHHALVRFVTDNGRDEKAYEKILQERFGVTTRITKHTTYEELTAASTGEGASRFQKFHAEEIVQIINTFEEMPAGMHKIPELRYLVRRLDGTPHPLYPMAPAVAWPDSGYIEFMDNAFLQPSISAVHRLILHEKAHFLWAHLFDEQLKADWIELGGWYRDVRSPSGWFTTRQTEFVSAYGHAINPNEDMAESVAFFVVNPDKLKSRAIGKYEFVRDRIMQGNFYISQIREDLTFEVYNLFPDYVFPGKIRRVDIRVTGAPEEDKAVHIEVELHALDRVLEGATYVLMRVVSDVGTYKDVFLYPGGVNRGETGTVLSGGFTLSKFAKAGYWVPTQAKIKDPAGNERFERGDDFGWSLYVNNPLEDVTPPRYVRNSTSLAKSVETREGREIQVILASWQVEEDQAMRDRNPCYATLNDELLETYRFEEFGSYDSRSGRCEVLFLMPHYMPSSVYTMNYVTMIDLALNRSGVYFGPPGTTLRQEDMVVDEAAAQVELITSNPDTQSPEVDLNAIEVSAEPTNPDAPNGETRVTLTFRIRDNIAGFIQAYLKLRDPQGIEHGFWVQDPNRFDLFPSGDPSQWTTYTWTVILPPGSAPGTWGLANMTVYDRAENIRQYDFTEIIHFEVESD